MPLFLNFALLAQKFSGAPRAIQFYMNTIDNFQTRDFEAYSIAKSMKKCLTFSFPKTNDE